MLGVASGYRGAVLDTTSCLGTLKLRPPVSPYYKLVRFCVTGGTPLSLLRHISGSTEMILAELTTRYV